MKKAIKVAILILAAVVTFNMDWASTTTSEIDTATPVTIENVREAPTRNPLKPDINIPFGGHGLIYYTPSCYEIR